MIDKEITRHLAELSKIEFTEQELEKMTVQMDAIISLMDNVKNFSSESVPYALDAKPYPQIRADEAKPSFETEKILSNAKNVKNNSFVVPKVV